MDQLTLPIKLMLTYCCVAFGVGIAGSVCELVFIVDKGMFLNVGVAFICSVVKGLPATYGQ